MADNYVKDINEHLKVGDEVEVKVINVEKDGKIGLSIKKAKERPPQPSSSSPSSRPSSQRPRSNSNRQGGGYRDKFEQETFEQKMNRFLKDSEDRLSTLKRATESKRGGRGARRG